MLNQEQITELMLSGRSGGVAIAEHRHTGRVDVDPIPVPELPTQVLDREIHSDVSAEIEWAPNVTFSKVSIRVWARTPCDKGTETETQRALVEMLHAAVVDYVENRGMPVLRKWESQR